MRLSILLCCHMLLFACLDWQAIRAETVFEENRGQLHRPGIHGELRLRLAAANRDAAWGPAGAAGETVSYLIGRDPGNWIREARHYRQLLRRSVYPGIDLAFYGTSGGLEYDFRVAAHLRSGLWTNSMTC